MAFDPNNFDPKSISNPSYGLRGLRDAHKLGVSWTKICMIMVVAVLVFIGVMLFLPRFSAGNTSKMDTATQKATDAATQSTNKMQADIQAQVDAKLKAAGIQP